MRYRKKLTRRLKKRQHCTKAFEEVVNHTYLHLIQNMLFEYLSPKAEMYGSPTLLFYALSGSEFRDLIAVRQKQE